MGFYYKKTMEKDDMVICPFYIIDFFGKEFKTMIIDLIIC